MSYLTPLWTEDDDPEETWTVGEIMAVMAVCHVPKEMSLHVLAVLRALHEER